MGMIWLGSNLPLWKIQSIILEREDEVRIHESNAILPRRRSSR